MSKAEVEARYLAFCKEIERDAMKIVGLAGTGQADAAAVAAAALAQKALTARLQYQMQQESKEQSADRYDLGALHVHADTPSNSETPFEEE